jgi:hypothetical protein
VDDEEVPGLHRYVGQGGAVGGLLNKCHGTGRARGADPELDEVPVAVGADVRVDLIEHEHGLGPVALEGGRVARRGHRGAGGVGHARGGGDGVVRGGRLDARGEGDWLAIHLGARGGKAVGEGELLP